VNAVPPPTAQTSLLLNCVELGSLAQCLALSFSETPFLGAGGGQMVAGASSAHGIVGARSGRIAAEPPQSPVFCEAKNAPKNQISKQRPPASRVCKAPFSYQRQRLKLRFRYANAERMAERASAFSLGVSQAKLHFGMQMWSVCKPTGGRVCKAPFSSQRQRLKLRFRYANAERM
jgi:hypothetical protein